MKRFRKVYVEITNICNMNCSFCPETKRAKAFMDVKQFEHIAKQIVEYTDYVYLHVKGEPLLHPRLNEILDVCNKYNLKINISTNATLLKDKQKILKEAHIRQLNISLHSFENVEDKKELKKYLKEVTTISNTLAKEEVIIRYKLWNDGNKNNDYTINYLNNLYGIDILKNTHNKDIKLNKNIFLSIKKPFKWPDINDIDEIHATCYGLRSQIAILVDGTVTPCCVDNEGDINLGNIFESNLNEILESKKAKTIKKGFEDNKCVEKLCKKCTYKTSVI